MDKENLKYYDIKSKYFALYFGQKVLYNGCDTVVVNSGYNWLHPSHILVLTPIEQISDDAAIKLGYLDPSIFLLEIGRIHLWQFDLLRQLGYATEFTTIVDGEVITYSVKELVELNIIKLKK